MDQSYTPISCDAHDILEAIATLHQDCSIQYRDDNDQVVEATGKINDVYTSHGAEFMKLDEQTIRLDRLVKVNDTVVDAACEV